MTRLIETGGSWSGRERHCCFLNAGDGPFADISSVAGLDFLDDGRGIATVDWDFDGKLDLWITSRGAPGIRFLYNKISSQPGYVSVLLVGESCNRDAIGARVQVDLTDGRSLTRSLHAGDAFLSQSSKWIHFGLGSEMVARLVVHWPDGGVESFNDVAPNRRYEIVQGGTLRPWSKPSQIGPTIGGADSIAPVAAQSEPASSTVRRVLLEPVPLPKLMATSFTGKSSPLAPSGQGPHLINLWAAWCMPCLGELKDFGARHSELQQAGVTISALSVDGLVGDEESNPARAMEVVQRLQLPFSTASASKELLDKLDVVQDVVTTRKTTIDEAFSFSIPTSFLLDEAGRISVIYQGAVEVDRLLADVALIRSRQLQATPFAGRWFLEPQDAPGILARYADRFLRRGYPGEAERYAGLSAALASQRSSDMNASKLVSAVYNDLGNHFDQKRDSATAEKHYLLALEVSPQSPQAHNNLGDVHYRRAEYEPARTHFREALRYNPKLIQAHMNLAAIDFTQGKLDEAMNGFRRALQIDPRFAVAHNYLGLALAKKENYSEAAYHFSEALRLEPGYSEAAKNLRSMRAMIERQP
ncbi:MAG: hypothetical protein CMJ64_16665 [Planctomycetaceae bacterium]|nr:hypothetical protein [Planctomycetaceae bacterium]